jgi:putative oxidoreductase
VNFLDKLRPITLLILRFSLGLIFLFHGYPKIAHGIGGTVKYLGSIGVPSPSFLAYLLVTLELGGGVLLILGLATRPVALLFTIEMCVALAKVHLANGIMDVHEYEFALLVGAASLALASIGAGSISLDYSFFGSSPKPKSRPKP